MEASPVPLAEQLYTISAMHLIRIMSWFTLVSQKGRLHLPTYSTVRTERVEVGGYVVQCALTQLLVYLTFVCLCVYV